MKIQLQKEQLLSISRVSEKENILCFCNMIK